ncbi:PEP-CTERM sorting domain-containing protein [Botrimarina hoheduenensis]|nr:PEP-CTERM sorting domain-containing protein [Botrimarina hoheduenensis]
MANAAVALLLGLCWITPSDGGLIATDRFLTGNPADPANGEYTVTQLRRSQVNGAGQDPSIAGFSGAWTGNVTSGSLAVAQWTAASDPTGTTVEYQEGGRARFGGSSAVNALQRRVQRELAPYTPSNTYYYSLITQIATGDLAGAPGFVGAGFTNTGATVGQTDANLVGGSALRGLLLGAASSDGLTTDFVLRHVGSSGSLQDEVLDAGIASVIPTQTVVRIDFNDDPGNPAGNSQLTVWHNPTNTSSESAASASVAPTVFRTFALGTNADMTHLTFAGINYSRAASFDEPRLATTWDAALAVPEPGSAFLMLIGVTALGMGRSRR